MLRSSTFLLLWPLSLLAQEPPPFSHALLDQVLQKYVDDEGLVDYGGLKEDRALLDAYIDSLRRTSPDSHPRRFAGRDHELAYWINAYNALVLRGVIDAYPVDSVMDIKLFNGFFNRTKWVLGGESMTLNHLENGIIRPRYEEPRIHFVVNCGARSCPRLENRAFGGGDLGARLEAALARFARNPRHVRLQDHTLYLSKILDWYGGDFAKWFPADRANPPSRPALINYLLPYLPADMAAQIRSAAHIDIEFVDYDWALNDQHRTSP